MIVQTNKISQIGGLPAKVAKAVEARVRHLRCDFLELVSDLAIYAECRYTALDENGNPVPDALPSFKDIEDGDTITLPANIWLFESYRVKTGKTAVTILRLLHPAFTAADVPQDNYDDQGDEGWGGLNLAKVARD